MAWVAKTGQARIIFQFLKLIDFLEITKHLETG